MSSAKTPRSRQREEKNPVPQPAPEKDPEINDIVKKLTAPLFGLLGSVAGIYQFIQLWRGDQSTVSTIVGLVALGFVLVALLYISFSKKSSPLDRTQRVARYAPYHIPARGGLAGMCFLALVGLVWMAFYARGYRIAFGSSEAQAAAVGQQVAAAGDLSVHASALSVETAVGQEDRPDPGERVPGSLATEPQAEPVNNPAGPQELSVSEEKTPLPPVESPEAPDNSGITYEWGGDAGWSCWTVPYNSVKKPKPYGTKLSITGEPPTLAFFVDFSKSAENQGRLTYLANSGACPALKLSKNAVVHAELRVLDAKDTAACGLEKGMQLLDAEMNVDVGLFLQPSGPGDLFVSQPLMALHHGEKTQLNSETWVTGSPAKVTALGEGSFNTLGIVFDLDQESKLPSGGICFSVTRVWISKR